MLTQPLLSYLPLTLISLILPTTAAYPPFGPYNITNFTTTTTSNHTIPGQCTYTFNITFAPAPSYPPAYESDTEPAFGPTTCAGSDQSGFMACADETVSANLTDVGGGRGNLTLMHVWLVPEGPETRAAEYTVMGTGSVELCPGEQPEEFQIFADQEQVEA